MITGWLFDAYALQNKMVLWIKNKKTHRIEVDWNSSLYVASQNKHKLKELVKNPTIIPFLKNSSWVERFEKVSDLKKSKVLKLTIKNPFDLLPLARRIEQSDEYGTYLLYNVDISSEQIYFYENDLFPLGKYALKDNQWVGIYNALETDYNLPTFTKVHLKVNPKKNQALPTFSDQIESIQIDETTIQSDSEEQTIIDLVAMIKEIDPDFIITEKGDTWDFPYLAQRAQKNNISDQLILGREKNHPLLKSKRSGTSYHAYGQVHFKPTATNLLGRIHIDKSNCFIWEHEYSIESLYEIARICRLPLQIAARASIGKCMSSIQFYNATKRKLLIPWKPIVSEIFKSRLDLFIGDRGGLIMEPITGTHENVGELDFVSMFGNIMLTKNISAETINCECCPNSENIVPELGYRICKHKGIVPQSLEILLHQREKYVELIETSKDPEKLKVYQARKTALKWILVTSFGYLGFNNAKFGRIDAHMSVCAFARKLLIQAIRIAEKNRFKVLHGIVDSIWIYKKDAEKKDFEKVMNQISEKTGFDISLNIYNWIVFLPSKEKKIVPVPNRYFGAKQDGKLKLRGIETRRHDTPKYFKQCQMDILNLFASCKMISDVKEAISEAKSIQKKYEQRLFKQDVPLEDLTFTNRVTKGTDQHKNNTIQADVLNQLKWEGKTIVPGQKIKYVINVHSRKSRRVIPIEIANCVKYDAKKYSELLAECCNSIITPFDN